MTADDIVTRAAGHLFHWNTPHDPYFVIGSPTRHAPDGVDPYAPIIAALVEGGFIATPEHDAAVAARALRDAAARIGGVSGPRGGSKMPDEVEWAQWLYACADRIEDGGEP